MVKFKSEEEKEGYESKKPLSANPYVIDVMTEEGRINYNDWEAGWKKRFHNEED